MKSSAYSSLQNTKEIKKEEFISIKNSPLREQEPAHLTLPINSSAHDERIDSSYHQSVMMISMPEFIPDYNLHEKVQLYRENFSKHTLNDYKKEVLSQVKNMNGK